MESTLKADICDFLASGCITTPHSIGDFKNAFYFLDYVCNENIAMSDNGNYIIAQNSNWFWLKCNDANRKELIKDIGEVEFFDYSDSNANGIISRLVFGDGYGIVTPLKRDVVEPFDEKAFKEATIHYSVYEGVKTFKEEYFRQKLYYKLIYCSKIPTPSIEAYYWDLCERLLKQPLNYYEYKLVDELVYGSIEELKAVYMSDEYDKLLTEMQEVLMDHKAHLVRKSAAVAQNIESLHQKGEIEKALVLWNTLQSFFEAPEGDSDKKKDRLRQAYVEAKNKIPARIRTDILNYEFNKKR